MRLIGSILVEVFVSVTVRGGLVAPLDISPKFRVVVERRATVPTPVSATLCGLPAALSEMVTAPVRTPLALGAKSTVMTQAAPAFRLEPQLLVCVKSPLT